jgi:hypothetical protein
MPKLITIFILTAVFNNCYSQPYKIYFGVNNSFSYGYFYSGVNLATGNQNISFSNFQSISIENKSSLDWSNELAGLSFFEALGRRHHINFGLEYFLNHKYSLTIGYELGSRNFMVKGDNRIIAFRSIRTHSVPILLSHYNKIHNNIYFKKNIGLSVNLPISKNQQGFPVNSYETKSYSPIYPLLNLGADIEYRFKNLNSILLGISYNQGFINIIKDRINYDIKFNDSQKLGYGSSSVFSNGSHWLFGVKYTRTFSPNKKPATNKPSIVKIPYSKREISMPTIIFVDSSIIKVCVFDEQTIDGDSVSIEYKDSVVIRDIRLDKNKNCINLKIEANQPNYLVIHALNEGRIKPNTVSLIIDDGIKEQKISIKATLISSGAVNLLLK